MIAVIANRVDVARLLIARGANVNIVDKNGMTPLMYAASIELARKYERVHVLKSLE